MKLTSLLKLKKEPAKTEEVAVVEEKVSYSDFLRAIGKRVKRGESEQEIAEKFKKLFPRTIEDLKVITTNKQGKSVAMDKADFNYGRKFTNEIPLEIMGFLNQTFIGWQACALLKQNPFIDRACTLPAKDAIAPDYKISYINDEDREEDEKTPDIDELADIKKQSDYMKIKEVCCRHVINKKTYGYSIVVPIVDGADMEKPFNIDGIKKGSYKGLTVIEPYWVTTELDAESASDPASPHFYEPTWYVMGGGKRIHRSWVVRSVNSEVSDVLKPTYYFGGVPLTQQIYERVYCAEKVANEAPMLAMTKRLLIVDANIANMVANPSEAYDVMNALTELRDNFGIYAKNPGDQVAQIDTSLADFDALIMTQYQLVASIAGIPATELLKTTPKGFNATGEYEYRDYKKSLLEIQENDFIPVIQMHNQLYTKSHYGRVIELDVKFNPIDTPSEKEVAEISSIQSQVAANHINAGITTAEEERNVLRNTEGSPYSAIPQEMPEPDIDLNFGDEENEEEVNGGKEETSGNSNE